MIYPYKNLSKTLFIDIETVSEYSVYDDLPDHYKALWKRKASLLMKFDDSATTEDYALAYKQKAAIFAEFGKVVCISCGFLSDEGFRVKSLYGNDEIELLNSFADLLSHHYSNPNDYYLCGHNIKEFDIPYLCRRMVKHGSFMPNMLDIAGKKPWQTEHLIDTLVLWRFGDYKNYTSISLLTAMLDIPTPKDDIDGSMVGDVFWKENDIERIAAYCAKDVITVAQIMMKYCGRPLIKDEDIVIVS